MKKKYFIFGSSSAIAEKLIQKIQDNNQVICFSSKKQSKKHKNIINIKTNYSISNLKKVIDKEIDKKNKNIFLFFNALCLQIFFFQNDFKPFSVIL